MQLLDGSARMRPMRRVEFGDIRLRPPQRFARLRQAAPWIVFVLFLGQFVWVWTGLLPGAPGTAAKPWAEGVLVVLCAAATLAMLAQQLPGQNVALAAMVIFFIAGTVEVLNGLSGVPFGPRKFTIRAGPEFFHTLAWPLPLLWIIFLLNSRGVARLVLRPWRRARNYGFWVLGLTVLLGLLLEAGLQPYAAHVKRYWVWQPTRLPGDWYGTPWVTFLGWGVTALLSLAFATPAMLNKRPVSLPPTYPPLLIWCLLNVQFFTGAATHQLWAASAVVGASTIIIGLFAVRGRKAAD